MKKSINQSLLSYILNGISIFALLLTAFWLFAYSSISGQLSEANEERYSLTYNANRFMNGSAYLTNEVRAFAATGDQVHYDNYWNEINNLKNRDLGVAAMQEIGITDQEQAMIDEMSALSNALVPLEEEAMKEVQEGKNQAAIDYVYGEEYSTAIAKINELKEQFLNDLDARTKTEVERLLRMEEIIKVGMVTAMIIVAVIQIASMLITRWRVLRPVIAVRDQMGEISKGNLSDPLLYGPIPALPSAVEHHAVIIIQTYYYNHIRSPRLSVLPVRQETAPQKVIFVYKNCAKISLNKIIPDIFTQFLHN